METHLEIQELLWERKFERLALRGEADVGATPETDTRLHFSTDSCLKKAAIIIETLWADPGFWQAVRIGNDFRAIAEFISHAYFKITTAQLRESFTNIDPTSSIGDDPKATLDEALKNRYLRQRFFSGLLIIAELAVRPSQSKSQKWFQAKRTDILACLEEYLKGPRNFPKRYLLRKFCPEDWHELHIVALELADDTEDIAHNRPELFPDFSESKPGRKRESETAQKIEWMADALIADTTLSDSEVARRAWSHFQDPGQTKLGRNQALKAVPGRLRKLAGIAKALVEIRHGCYVTHYSEERDGKKVGRNLPNRKKKPAP